VIDLTVEGSGRKPRAARSASGNARP